MAIFKRKYIYAGMSNNLFNFAGYTIVTIFSLFCLLPFIIVLSGSFSDENAIEQYGYSLIPKVFSLEAYKTVFIFPQAIVNAYKVTAFVTVAGSLLGLFFISMAGFVLWRKEFRLRNAISFFIYFTTLFSGGLIPWYLVITQVLHLKDSLGALILPYVLSPFLIILMRSFMNSIPEEIVESAKIDGAKYFRIYYQLILPLTKPALATIGLFLALQYWNDWFSSSVFIVKREKFSLQYVLYNILNTADAIRQNPNIPNSVPIPRETVKLATAVIATGPIILLYPFVQRYFISGLTIGAVKG
jgi:putative aldouronate transport system permease protein